MKKQLATTAIALALTLGPVQAGDWSGGYVGAYAGAGYSGNETIVGLVGGYSWQTGIFVYGAEVDAFSANPSGDTEVFLNARAGAGIGENVLVFAKVGRGQYNGSTQLYGAGGGAEYAVNQNLSVRFDHEWHNALGSELFTGPTFTKLGAVWSF